VSDNQDIFQSYYDFSSGDYEAMESYLMNVNWSYEFTFVFNVEDYWQIFANHLNTAIEAYVPMKKKPIHINRNVTTEPTGRSVVFCPCCAELLASFVFTFFACIY